MATQPNEEQGNWNHAEPAADIENDGGSFGSAPSQFGDAPETSEEEVNEPYCRPLLQAARRGDWDFELTLSPTDIENAGGSVGSAPSHGSVGSAPSQSGDTPETSEEEVNEPYYRPLLQAAFRGDWDFAMRFFERDAASKMANITSRSETVLHIAALSAQDQFLENLVKLLCPHPEVLERVDRDGRTALHNAVLCGRIRMVKALVKSNPKLTQLADNDGRVPWHLTAEEASMHKEIAWFLAKNTRDDGTSRLFNSPSAIKTVVDLTCSGHHDIVLYLVGRHPHFATMKIKADKTDDSILCTLALMPSHFPSGTRLNVLEALIYKCIPVDLNYKPTDKNSDPALQCLLRPLWSAAKIIVPIIKRIHEVKSKHVTAIALAKKVCMVISHMSTNEISDFFEDGEVLFEATARGISEIVKLCIQFFPKLIWIRPHDYSLPTHAVEFRQERTLAVFLTLSSTAELSLVLGPTMKDSMEMMAVAKLYFPSHDAETNVAGAAFQLQREVQWFKAVESLVIPIMRSHRFRRDDESRTITYWSAFVEAHKELLEKGEKWVKDTADSCMLVSALIATVLFAAAFTVPGGNDNNTGVPLLLGQDSFLIFTISDALGLFSSVTAILLFLAILTSRYEAQDFLKSLPKKIIMGLCFLFLSLAFMMVAFTATLTIVLDKRVERVLIPITLLASLPMVLFVLLQLPLLYQMVKSTYGPSIFRPEGIWDGVNYTKQDQ